MSNKFLFITVILISFFNSPISGIEVSMDYSQLKIKETTHWEVYLHENQCYLGRVFILLKDASKENFGIDDFVSIEGEVRDEFFQLGKQIKSAYKSLFKPDKMNYAALSNTSPKIHVHFIPRYKEPREFAGTLFNDLRWGKNYAPYDKSFKMDIEMLFKIRDALKEKI